MNGVTRLYAPTAQNPDSSGQQGPYFEFHQTYQKKKNKKKEKEIFRKAMLYE